MPRKKKTDMLISDERIMEAEQQIKDMQREVDYDIRDYTIDWIVKKFQEAEFYIPDYQREYVWPNNHRTRFIESILLGLPIPFMFLAAMDDGRLEIVDGVQRIQTLETFLNNDLVLKGLDKLPTMNGFRFSDLPKAQQRKFVNRALRMIILEDTTTVEIRQEIFGRINTSSYRARASEIRRGTFAGPFVDLIQECAQNPLFLKLCPISKKMIDRREPEELVTRFFAYSDRYLSFRHDVDRFLDRYVQEHREHFDRERLTREFVQMLEFVNKYFPHGFSKSKMATTTPRVRFEAISVGVNLALREIPGLIPGPVNWLDSEEFNIHTTTHASNSGPRVRGRIEFVRDQLLASSR